MLEINVSYLIFILYYIARTNVQYFHDYLMYVIALPIIILKHFFFYSIGCSLKTMANQYTKVNESYRIIIPIFQLMHFSFLLSQKYLSMFNVV